MKHLHIYFKYCCYLMVVFLFLFIVASGSKHEKVMVNNINNIKSIPVANLSSSYKAMNEQKQLTQKVYNSFDEAIMNAKSGNAAFYGKLTGYGPDCKGCGGHTACRPSQNVKNGNIYYNDKKYGKIRILAADKSIPCGTIIRVNNINIYSEPVVAIVLDRGGAIKGSHLDLLFATQKNMGGFRTQNNLKFDIMRWGF
ncbi:MAG: 3D domain-containing protein [Bacilli bacterium]|nr:3D domain-containing protein [Bacilli bacterium]